MRYHLSAVAAGLAVAFALLTAYPSEAAQGRQGAFAVETNMNGEQQYRSGSGQG